MNLFKAAYCRIFQGAFRLALPLLPYRDPAILPTCGDVPSAMAKEGTKRALIVTDDGVWRCGLTRPVEEAIAAAGLHSVIFAGTQANPTVANVEEALELYRRQGCDCLIAIGGGSAMDCAKAVGARLAHPAKPLQRMRGVLRVWRKLPPLIAIPTTAGTGSEVTLAAVITDPAKHDKYALMSFPLIPRYAVLDPALTVSLPRHLTASTGMDALTHAVEAYIGRSTTRHTRALALDAVRLIFANLDAACSCPDSIPARQAMLDAAYKAGAAFSQSYVGYVHALAHALGGRYGTPHGLANAILMPHVLEATGRAAHRKLHQLGVAAGVCAAEDAPEQGAAKFIRAIREMNARLGIPATLTGVDPADVPALARHAEKEANPLYPVPQLMTADELAAILRTATSKEA